jgi:hypothetical protein
LPTAFCSLFSFMRAPGGWGGRIESPKLIVSADYVGAGLPVVVLRHGVP